MTIRDADRFGDKVEVSLDSRQIFFLFFGGAVVDVPRLRAGRHGRQAHGGARPGGGQGQTSAASILLAALDELGAAEANADSESDLAFPSALGPTLANPSRTARPHGRRRPPRPSPRRCLGRRREAGLLPPSARRGRQGPDGRARRERRRQARRQARGKVAAKVDDSPRQEVHAADLVVPGAPEADALVVRLNGTGYQPFVVDERRRGQGPLLPRPPRRVRRPRRRAHREDRLREEAAR